MSGTSPAPLLTMRRIGKHFDGVTVLRDVDFTLRAGEVHALVGENGAGKSTLIKILAGVHTEFQGEIRLGSDLLRFRTPRDAEVRGIAVIHQELALVPHLSVVDNLFLGREPTNALGWIRRGEVAARARALLADRLGTELDVDRPVAELPIALQQVVEIAKALTRAARVLVMDEPTSALSDLESRRLFELVRQLRSQGAAIVFISHKLDEIYALADRITVLRDGRKVGESAAAELPPERLVEWMVGRRVDQLIPRHSPAPGPELLRVEHVWLDDPHRRRWLVRDASLRLHAGEIVGLAGLVDSGNSELLGAIFGRHGRPPRGSIIVDGSLVTAPSPPASIGRGMALLTNDRQATGLVLPLSVLHNMTLTTLDRCLRAGWLSGTRERQRCRAFVERLRLRGPSLDAQVTTLSGGNQQKVVFARWLMANPRVLLLDEPTRGIDISAKADIYALLNELTAAGLGILLVTSELPELLVLSDRILVMHRGRIVSELARPNATQERVLRTAMGAQC